MSPTPAHCVRSGFLRIFPFLHYLLNSIVYSSLGDWSTVYAILKLISNVINVLLSSCRVKILRAFAEPDDRADVQQTGRPHWISAGLSVEGAEGRN